MSSAEILAWQDDPGQPDSQNQPIDRPVPETNQAPFPSEIAEAAPAPGGAAGSSEFRYWAAADALRRVADFWGGVAGDDVPWHSTVGPSLTVNLDNEEEEDLNAFYDRSGLSFFHAQVGNRTFYSGESPDVVCHEFGHAILDALSPGLFEVLSAEPPALHESFGDMSAMLTSLQLPDFRADVLAASAGRIDASSRLSRLAEQLGWAIRQSRPDLVEADCLRNAANSFFYRDPLTLPPRAPSTALSSEPHSFSRVFTGAFLTALAGMLSTQERRDDAALEQVSQDAGRLLVEAARTTPVVPTYFSQFAAHMLAADKAQLGGRYTEALRTAFVKHGVLALTDATSTLPAEVESKGISEGGDEEGAGPRRIPLPGEAYGLGEELMVHAAAARRRFAVSSAALDTGAVPEPSHEAAAAGYVEDVFRRGHVAIHPEVGGGAVVAARPVRATHEIRREDDSLVLARRLFHCGWPDPEQ
jgi:hypothetical protein